MKATVGVAALVAVLIAATGASASRPASQLESRWMSTNATAPSGQYVEWGRVSTVDPHYGIYYAKRCARRLRSVRQEHAPDVRVSLTPKEAHTTKPGEQQMTQAQVRPPYRLAQLCRATPRRVRIDLLLSLCGR